uniref:non-specific serine/threonine protein kinase n=2 Tax=Lunularia cruciata TaxID=56931 RepID=A0A126X269_9MARC|nr:putative LOV domain-containing protein [Lunularia cruciata]
MMPSTESSPSKPYNLRKQGDTPTKTDVGRDARGSLEVFGGAPQTSALLFSRSAAEDALAAAGIRPSQILSPSGSGRLLPALGPLGSDGQAAPLSQSMLKEREKSVLGTERSVRTESGRARDQVDRWLATVDERAPPPPKGPTKEPSTDFSLDDDLELPVSSGTSQGAKGATLASPEWAGAKGKGVEKGPSQAPAAVAPELNEPAPEPATIELPEEAQAERAAQWGVLMKSTAELQSTGRASGSREERISASGLSRRTSEGSEPGSGDVPRVSRDLKDALASFQQTFVVSDATRSDFPILYASAGFFAMTGYTPREVIGRNCRFLQGPETDPQDIERIRAALKEGRSYCGRLLNYRKDGAPFWNLLTIAPIKDDTGKVLKYIGMQVEVSKYTEGLKSNEVRPNGMPASLIKYDARQQDRATSSVQELVGALKHPHAPATENKSEVGLPPLFSVPPLKDELQLKVPSRFSTQSLVALPLESSGTSTRAKSESVNRLTDLPEQPTIGESGARGGQSHRRSSGLLQMLRKTKAQPEADVVDIDDLDLDDDTPQSLDERAESIDDSERAKEIRRGMDLATTLERIEKNFVITDPRLPDNPIIFASDHFLELTEYTREEIIGRNCRFLQGVDTDLDVVRKISEAIKQQQNITVQLLNYTKSGKPFWNLFHLEAMKDNKGELQYFIGVQLDGSEHIEPIRRRLSEKTEEEGKKIVQATAKNVDGAVRELPDANMSIEDLWANHSRAVLPRPHKRQSSTWHAMRKVLSSGDKLGLNHFRPIKPLGCGDTGSVHLVELRGTSEFYAMKAMDKNVMVNRNKVHRARAEREILEKMDHPFLPTLYGSFQTRTHVCLITDFCPGGELFLLLERQPQKKFREESSRFYAAEIVLALEYLHCLGVVYRDLKPENVLVQKDGHVQLTDFDLSFLTASRPQLLKPVLPSGRKHRRARENLRPILLTEPVAKSNSFVGTEEYIAPEIILGLGHNSSVDWWALGILLYEMLFGRTPFRGRNRQRTFANVLHKDLAFPSSIPVSLAAKQVIRGLLQRDPKKRLGSDKGAYDLKQHSFFRGINWPLIRCMTPPPLETPIYQIGKEADTKDLDWEELDPSAASFEEVF